MQGSNVSLHAFGEPWAQTGRMAKGGGVLRITERAPQDSFQHASNLLRRPGSTRAHGLRSLKLRLQPPEALNLSHLFSPQTVDTLLPPSVCRVQHACLHQRLAWFRGTTGCIVAVAAPAASIAIVDAFC